MGSSCEWQTLLTAVDRRRSLIEAALASVSAHWH